MKPDGSEARPPLKPKTATEEEITADKTLTETAMHCKLHGGLSVAVTIIWYRGPSGLEFWLSCGHSFVVGVQRGGWWKEPVKGNVGPNFSKDAQGQIVE